MFAYYWRLMTCPCSPKLMDIDHFEISSKMISTCFNWSRVDPPDQPRGYPNIFPRVGWLFLEKTVRPLHFRQLKAYSIITPPQLWPNYMGVSASQGEEGVKEAKGSYGREDQGHLLSLCGKTVEFMQKRKHNWIAWWQKSYHPIRKSTYFVWISSFPIGLCNHTIQSDIPCRECHKTCVDLYNPFIIII